MSTVSEWGPAAWKFLHSVTFSYPDAPTIHEQMEAENLFTSLRTLLPCEACREHYESEISVNPPDTRSRATLSAWLVDLHNRVNVRLGKPIYSYASAEQAYSSQCSSDCARAERTAAAPMKRSARVTNNEKNGYAALSVLLILILVFAIIFRNKLTF
jgi:hypothetical protein